MENTSDQVDYYLQRFREGDSRAFYSLIELPDSIIPQLISEFRRESDRNVRAFLVEVIWQHRNQSCTQFLGEALADPEPMVWQEAIDGLVALKTPAAIEELRRAKQRQFAKPADATEFREWVEEAIGQIEKEQQS